MTTPREAFRAEMAEKYGISAWETEYEIWRSWLDIDFYFPLYAFQAAAWLTLNRHLRK